MTETAVCAVHPGQPAYTTCARCGNFACSYCLGERDICAACVARDEGDVIPWERKDLSLPVRFWRTTRDVISRPVHALCEQRSSSTGDALKFSILVPTSLAGIAFLCCAPFFFLAVVGMGMSPQRTGGSLTTGQSIGYAVVGLVAILACGPLGVFAGTLVRGALFHVSALIAGGKGGFDASLRICAYMTAFFYVDLIGMMLGWIPVVGIVVALLVLVVELIWSGRTLTAAARAHHGLADGRAAIAGWLTPALYFLFALGLLAFFAVAQFSGGPAPDSYD